MRTANRGLIAVAVLLGGMAIAIGIPSATFAQDEPAGFKVPATWQYTAPLIAPEPREQDRSRAQKDPTVVQHGGRWHVFMTVKLPGRSAIEYCSFERWEDADRSRRTTSSLAEASESVPTTRTRSRSSRKESWSVETSVGCRSCNAAPVAT